MRYVRVPAPVMAIDTTTSKPIGPLVTFSEACMIALAAMADSKRTQLDVLSLIDLRGKLARLSEGVLVELSEPEWKALEAEFKSGSRFGSAYLFVSEPHVRAVLEASTKKPEPTVLPAPEASPS